MSRFRTIFAGVDKPLIAMAHVPPLPGTPLFDAAAGVLGLIDHVKRDMALLLDALSGEHPADPLSLPLLPKTFLESARSDWKPNGVSDRLYAPLSAKPARNRRECASRFAVMKPP